MATTLIQIDTERGEGRLRMLLSDSEIEVGHILFELHSKDRDVRSLRVTHTYVAPEYRGQSYAQELAEAIDAYALDCGYDLEATCSYIERYLARKAHR